MATKKKSAAEREPTQYVELRGKVKWAKVFEENRDKFGPKGTWEEFGGKTSINLFIDDEQYAALKAAGSQKQLKDDAEGDGKYVSLDRKWEAPYTYGGPPQVLHADGRTPWDIDDDGLIGNGSECAVIVTIYDTGTYKGTRLDVVQVIDHVAYDSEYNGPPKPKDYTKGEQVSKTAVENAQKAAKKKPVEDELEDEIPF